MSAVYRPNLHGKRRRQNFLAFGKDSGARWDSPENLAEARRLGISLLELVDRKKVARAAVMSDPARAALERWRQQQDEIRSRRGLAPVSKEEFAAVAAHYEASLWRGRR